MGNLNNTFFDALDAAATWSAGVAFKRSKGLPLDKYSVFESKDLAIEYAEKRGAYAETPVSYPGQVIAVQEGTKMVAYVLNENTDSTKLELQQIGIIPTGDGKTINVTEDGVISLLAADAQVDEKNEDGEATGNKVINAGAQLVLQSDGTIKWVQPDTSTAEGQAAAISGLKTRVDAIEPIVVKPIEGAEPNPEQNLWDALDAETKRADEAEKAIDKKVSDVNTALVDYAKTADVNKTLEDYAKTTDVNKTLEDYAKTADVKGELAKKADKTAYDQTVLDLEALEGKVDAFLTGTGASDALDSLQELINYINTHDDVEISGILGDIQAIENKLVLGTYVDGEETKEYATVKAYVEAVIDALKIGDYAKASDLADLDGRVGILETMPFDTYATKTEVENVDKKFANYTTTSELEGQLNAKADANKVYTKEEITALNHATKSEVEQAVAAEAEIARAAEKANADAIKAIKDDDVLDSFADVVTALAGKQDKLVEGSYATESYVDTKVKTLEDGAVAEAKAQADKGVSDAATAKTVADRAEATANTNAANIDELENVLYGKVIVEDEEYPEQSTVTEGLIGKVASNTTKISTVEGATTANTASIKTINETLPNKANQSSLNDTNSRVSDIEAIVGHEAKTEGDSITPATGLVKKVADNSADIVNLKERLSAEEEKVDNNTTYTFRGNKDTGGEGTEIGDVLIVDSNMIFMTAHTGIKEYVDAEFLTLENTDLSFGNRLSTLEGQIGGLSGAMHFMGVVEIDPTSEAFNTEGYEIGDVVIFGNKEYVFAEINEEVDIDGYINIFQVQKFVEFGDATINADEITKLAGKITKLETKVDLADNTTVTGKIGDALDEAKEYTDELAKKAIQTIGAGTGLKATVDATDATKITIDIDEAVTFILRGGSATGFTTITENN